MKETIDDIRERAIRTLECPMIYRKHGNTKTPFCPTVRDIRRISNQIIWLCNKAKRTQEYVALKAENAKLKKHVTLYKELAKLRDELLVCYRIGKRPTCKLLDRLPILSKREQALKEKP